MEVGKEVKLESVKMPNVIFLGLIISDFRLRTEIYLSLLLLRHKDGVLVRKLFTFLGCSNIINAVPILFFIIVCQKKWQ